MTQYTPNEWLMKYYHHLLMYSKEGEEAKKYLNERGIEEETIKKFALGYSPRNEKMTLEFLKSKGFKLEALTQQKILIRYRSGKKEGQIGDLFSGRITIPIIDFKGDIVAFGGRSLKKDDKIKYLNSPSNKYYTKGDNLFGFSHAEPYIRKSGFVILVEGYFDVMQAHQAGFKNTVAVLGKELTQNQAILLKSVTNNAVIVFDGDNAGKEASHKIGKTLKNINIDVRIAETNEGNDPDDFIRSYGKEAFMQLLSNSKEYFDSLLYYYAHIYNGLNTPMDRFTFAQKVLEQISQVNDKYRKNAIVRLSNFLGTNIASLYNELID